MGQGGGWSARLDSMGEEWRRAGSPEENQSPGSQRRGVFAFAAITPYNKQPQHFPGFQPPRGPGWLDSGPLHSFSHSGTQTELGTAGSPGEPGGTAGTQKK